MDSRSGRPKALPKILLALLAVVAVIAGPAAPVAAAPPDAPGNVAGVVVSSTEVTVSWDAPALNGATLDGYTITSSPPSTSASVDDVTTTVAMTGLTPGETYTFSVVANSASDGDSAAGSSGAVTTFDVPTSPTGVAGSSPTATSMLVSWTPPADDGGTPITSYTVEAMPGGATAAAGGGDTSVIVPGLSSGTAYTFVVVATNAVGDSLASTPSGAISTVGVPGAPTGVSGANPTVSTIEVSWTPPADNGGGAITGYTVTASPGGSNVVAGGSDTTATVTGLSASTAYTFTVVAMNAAGSGPASTPSAPSSTDDPPATAPDAPTGVAASNPSTDSIDVAWTAPGSDGGSPVTGYTVTASPGGATATTTGATTATVNGLAAATSYTFTVTATNAVGTGTASAASNSVATDPIAPGAFTVSASAISATSVELTWSDPGGAPDPTYSVSFAPTGPSAAISGRSATVTGMNPGTTYTATVTATNAGGSRDSALNVTADAVPGTPSGVAGSVSTVDGVKVTVSWTLPSNTGTPIDTFRLRIERNGEALAPIDVAVDDVDVSGGTASYEIPSSLDRGDYRFRLQAGNEAGFGGNSPFSAVVDVPTSPGPTQITLESVTRLAAGDFSPLPFGPFISIDWEPPQDTGGLPITEYTVEIAGITQTVPATVTSAVIGPMPAGTYFASITAVTAAGSSTATSGQVAVRGFPPFDDRDGFVRQQYSDFLGRAADAGGLAFYVNSTNLDGSNAAHLIATFMDSPEFAPRRSIVRLYEAYFGRDPDLGGFDFWANRLATGASSINHVSASFAASQEFQDTYGSLGDEAFVRLVYERVLERQPDAGGLVFWTAQLAGGMDRGTMMTNFSESPEYIAKTAAHVDVVMTYRGLLDRLPDSSGYEFWVGQVNGDRNELLRMIHGFLISPEYAQRVTP